jgi:hypothetical protein
MKQLCVSILAAVAYCCGASGVRGQSATVIETTKQSQSYTFSNAAGFSITNNGTLSYPGPLNQLTGSPCCSSATLNVDGQAIVVTPSTFEADTGLKANLVGGNTLSSQLANSTMNNSSGTNQLSIQYDVVIGGVTRVGASSSYSIQEKVDGQSMSIFPKFQPSVFP